MLNNRSNTAVFLTLALLLLTGIAAGQKAPEGERSPLIGHWVAEDGTKVEIRHNGTLTINGEEYAYKVKGSVITVTGDEGAMQIPFALEGDKLTVEVEGLEIVYARVRPGAKAKDTGSGSGSGAGMMQALVGKWCYMSNLTGSNSRMSNRCFTLYENGTYEYSAETSSSGAVASSASQEYDTGRWSATRTTLTAFSEKHGRIDYPIELRNHPKTGDAMIVVDGDAYVTAYQRRPW